MNRACLIAILATVLAACGSGFQAGVGGLRTYPVNRDPNMLCTLGLDLNPPVGTLAGAPADVERVWLVGDDGQRISVAWPEGFSVRFEPDVVLVSDRGNVVARAGDHIELHGAHEFPGDGSFERPYIPYKTFGCHPPQR